MKILVKRKVTDEEIFNLIQRRLPPRYHIKLEDLQSAYMEYEEEGETILTVSEEYDLETVRRLLTPRMTELLEIIKKERYSISELAKKLNRSPSNVYNDVKFLVNNKFALLLSKGRAKIPILLIESIEIKI
ncbi:MAG TPA: HTH domain-containing protein [Thermofilum sp.]|nr:HTH domain-containing protein [Thermofilum sp.]